MKTEISRFCTVCSESLQSLPPALDAASEQCEQGGALLQKPLAVFYDVRARLRSLTDKLGSQQAYLLIFGPLKSGKSTLMNAISGAYVSEVTSLPGYPCLVFVQHSPQARYSVTRYNGRESVFPNPNVLNDAVVGAHLELAKEIRSSEERGDTFDPRSTFPEAIRRIDIKVPVETLAESSTVLVDTPGLYSRMNFGYDVLTREFRDSAACAVFVVKTDNLFLEQVFAEFNQLLGLFSRIFIVVNVDASKRDLAPDGSLHPSAESQQPGKILEAFTTLSMGAPLRDAYEAGRVRIHAVDLLGAASEFLSGTPVENTHRPAFDEFLRDLTEYLNSSDYTKEFIRDSLRQARTLCDEAKAAATGSEVDQMRDHQAVLAEEIRQLDARLAATERLLQVNWTESFQQLQAEHAHGADEDIRVRTAQVREDMRQGLDRWFSGNDSLAALTLANWNPTLREAGRNLSIQARERLQSLASRSQGGLQFAPDVVSDLNLAGFSPAQSGQRALATVNGEDDGSAYQTAIDPQTVPVRKTLLDWLLFRRVSKVRRRLFGEDQQREIPVEEKAKRLRDESRVEFEKLMETAVQSRFPARPAKFGAELAATYATRSTNEIVGALRNLREQLTRERAARQVPFDRQERILSAVDALSAESNRVAADIDRLAEQEDRKLSAPSDPTFEAAVGAEETGYLLQTATLPLL
jgi:hypothetical protein